MNLIRHASLALAWLALPGLVAAQTAPGNDVPANPAVPELELVVLGSGGPGALGRAASSFVVLVEGKPRILVDAGPGAFVRSGEEKISLRDLDIVLLTHLHADHVSELPGMFKAAAVSVGKPVNYRIFGPIGNAPYPATTTMMDLMFGSKGAFAYLSQFAAPLHFHTQNVGTLGAKDAKAAMPQVLVDENGLRISAMTGHHGMAPAVLYRVDYHGHSMTFSGDIDHHGLPALTSLAQGTELLVFNSVVLDPPGSPSQLYDLHTPPKMIGELAKATGAGQLLLNHLGPAIDKNQDAVLGSIRMAYPGKVTFSEDRLHLPLPAKR